MEKAKLFSQNGRYSAGMPFTAMKRCELVKSNKKTSQNNSEVHTIAGSLNFEKKVKNFKKALKVPKMAKKQTNFFLKWPIFGR